MLRGPCYFSVTIQGIVNTNLLFITWSRRTGGVLCSPQPLYWALTLNLDIMLYTQTVLAHTPNSPSFFNFILGNWTIFAVTLQTTCSVDKGLSERLKHGHLPWSSSRMECRKDGSSVSFSAISSGKYFSLSISSWALSPSERLKCNSSQ